MAELIDSQTIFFNNFEPKTKNRFIMYIDGIPAYLIKATDRPKLELGINVIEHININRKTKSGKSNWKELSVTLYDAIVPSGAQAVMEWIRLSHESVTGRDGYASFYKKDITIDVLDPVGAICEQWILKGAFISDAEFGNLDWAAGEVQEFTFTLAMDYAILNF